MKASSEDFQFIRNARNSAKLTLALGFVALIVFPNPSHPSVTFNFDKHIAPSAASRTGLNKRRCRGP
jgi:hypothetical protein